MDTTPLTQRFLAAARAAFSWLADAGRAMPLALVAIVLLWLIATPNPLLSVDATDLQAGANPSKVGIFAWLICKEAGLAYLGYWVDRLLHPNSRPSQFRSDPSDSLGTTALDVARMAAEKRRAFIVAAAMLAGGLIQ